MGTPHLLSLIVHITGGTAALIAGAAVMVARKGTTLHRLLGRAFVIGQAGASLSAIVLAILHPNRVLLMIGVFSLHLVVAGLRAARHRDPRASFVDAAITAVGAVNAAAMFLSGQVVMIVFGCIAGFLALSDVRMWWMAGSGASAQRWWLRRHIGHMVGGYISTVTAFLVVNFSDRLGAVAWLTPTVVLVPVIVHWIRRHATVTRRGVVACLATAGLLLPASDRMQAQPFVDGGRTRHRFAQMTLGLDGRVMPGNGTHAATTDLDGVPLPTTGELRLLIGGTHFWGHAHFELGVPLVRIGDSGFRTGIETSAHCFPWAIRYDRVRPWFGISFLPLRYRQGDGPELERIAGALSTGVVYARQGRLAELGFTFDPCSERSYPVSREDVGRVRTPSLWFTLAIRGMFDTTVSAEDGWSSGRTRALTDTLASQGRLSGPTFSAGVSTAFLLSPGDIGDDVHPWLVADVVTDPFPELAMGWYFHGTDLQVEVLARRLRSSVSGYGATRSMQRLALTASSFKFIGDLHGFAPFLGLSVGGEEVTVEEQDDAGGRSTGSWCGWRPGLVAGWDIRPDRLQRFLLRTAVRWSPALHVAMDDRRVFTLDQLEVNFIQLVIMLDRW